MPLLLPSPRRVRFHFRASHRLAPPSVLRVLPRPLVVCASIAALVAVIWGCSQKQQQPTTLTGLGGTTSITPEELQAAVMSFADRHIARVADASDLMEPGLSPKALALLLKNKTATAETVYTIATESNPIVATLDMTVYVTLKRKILEEYWSTKVKEGEIRPLSDAYRKSEEDIWKIARGLLSTSAEQELQELIEQWRKDNPEQRYVMNIRFSVFDTFRNRSPETQSRTPSSLFQLLYLDPLAGMEPTAREVARVRLTLEQEAFYLKRMPIIMSFLTRQIGAEYAESPEFKKILDNVTSFAGAAEQFSSASERFAADLGTQGREVIAEVATETSRQREQLVKDLSKLMDDQRAAIANDLASHEQGARAVMTDVRATSESLQSLAKSLDTTIQAADGLVSRVEAPQTRQPGAPEPRPFDVREYEAAATKVADAAREVTRALDSLQRPAPSAASGESGLSEMAAMFEAASTRAIDRAFYRMLTLSGVTIVGAAGAFILVRRLSPAR